MKDSLDRLTTVEAGAGVFREIGKRGNGCLSGLAWLSLARNVRGFLLPHNSVHH